MRDYACFNSSHFSFSMNEKIPPLFFYVVEQLDTKRTKIPEPREAAVNFGRLKDESPSFAKNCKVLHGNFCRSLVFCFYKFQLWLFFIFKYFFHFFFGAFFCFSQICERFCFYLSIYSFVFVQVI